MIARWPSELPLPMRDGFQHSAGEGRFKSSGDTGPPRVRGRFSSVANTVSMTLELERDGLARFERFYTEEVAKGAKPFLMADPTLDGYPMMTADGAYLTDGNGALLTISATWLVLFADQLPTTVPMGNRWRVSFQLSIMP